LKIILGRGGEGEGRGSTRRGTRRYKKENTKRIEGGNECQSFQRRRKPPLKLLKPPETPESVIHQSLDSWTMMLRSPSV